MALLIEARPRGSTCSTRLSSLLSLKVLQSSLGSSTRCSHRPGCCCDSVGGCSRRCSPIPTGKPHA